jgi:hypothetical protein
LDRKQVPEKAEISPGPFLAIAIIAGVRRILLIEAPTSLVEYVETEKLYEIGLSAIVVLILMIAY